MSQENKPSAPIRILHLEDSDIDSELLVRHLKKSGLEFTYERKETREGLSLALESGGHDLVISDYSLGMFNGIEALIMVRAKDIELPFIMLSGNIGEELAAKAMKLGANDYLMKGNLSRLVPAMEREVREAQVRREKKAIEHELRDREQELNQSQKMEALGRLAGGIAHDFNNLLAVISLNADSIASSKEHTTKVEEIRQAVDRGASMVRQLMTFSKRGILPEDEFVSLNELVSQMLPMFKRLIGKNVKVSIELQDSLPMVGFVQSQVEQVLLNLVVNARDAMEGNGTICIRTFQERSLDKNQEIERAYCVLEVEDSGCGMSEEVKGRIFEPFFSTKGTGKGTGLGLSTVYGIMTRSEGIIRVDSEVGRGTRFQLLFPIVEDRLRIPEPELPQEQFIFRSVGTKILLVEDDGVFGSALARSLNQAGCITVHAISPETALLILAEKKFQPDLLVADLTLPGSSGLRLAETAAKEYGVSRALIISANSLDTAVSKAIKNLDVHFLGKPLTVQAILLFIDGAASESVA